MFAVYAARPNPEDPLASLVVGDRPEAEVPDGWVRVKISHAVLTATTCSLCAGSLPNRTLSPFQ
jgi:hypothetical protein